MSEPEKFVPGSSLRELADRMDGRLSLPGDQGWDQERLPWNLAIDQRPLAVAVAGSVRDVQEILRTAGQLGLRVAPQSTGHHAAPMGPLDDAILLRLGALSDVDIDPGARIARVGAGAVWQQVTDAAAKYGLAALAGSAHDVGVAGYTLGGGLSWFGRSHGLAADHVAALEVVTADGQARRVSPSEDPDLFWALRGGGGSYAVVTALELELFPISTVQAGAMFFPLEQAREALNAWLQWTQTVPEEVMSCGRVLRLPAMPELPPFLSGQSFTVLEFVSTLSAEETDDLLAPLRALNASMDTVITTPVTALSQLHMDPPGPAPAAGDGFLLESCPEEAVDAWLAVAGPGVETSLLSVELRHLGGALTPGRSSSPAAVDGLEGSYVGYAVGFAPTADIAAVVRADVAAVMQALAPWTLERCYVNFAETSRSGQALFGEEAFARLRQVKAAYDPRDVIRAHHPVPAA